jgi:hypothetical protein
MAHIFRREAVFAIDRTAAASGHPRGLTAIKASVRANAGNRKLLSRHDRMVTGERANSLF